MWYQNKIYAEPLRRAAKEPRYRFRVSSIILLTIFTLLIGSLFARVTGEDYNLMQDWELPATAVPMSELSLEDEILLQDGQPFEGWAYELYTEGTLLQAVEYKQGRLHGYNLMWYPDGTPQMNATYQEGALHGRFLGWYPDGSVIYDRYINLGKYASDNLADRDRDRLRDETEIIEREGNTNDSTPE